LELDLSNNDRSLWILGRRAFNGVIAGIEALLSQRRERTAADVETVQQQVNQAVANLDAERVDIPSSVFFEAAPKVPMPSIPADMETVRQKINQAVTNLDAEPVDIPSPVFFEAALREPRALLGTGTFGDVFLIVDPALVYGRPFAVKRIKLGLDDQQRQVARRTFRTEIQVSTAPFSNCTTAAIQAAVLFDSPL
jgi:hypothetical protein